MKKQALGKGLSALLEEMGGNDTPDLTHGPSDRGVRELSIAEIFPAAGQPRRHFDETALRELADSIGTKGVLQPILVRPTDGGSYEIIAGERRWRASQLAGLHKIPAIVREMSDVDSFEAALIENVQRQDLNPVEEAAGYQKLIREFGHTQEMVATLTGKARSHVANLLRLLDLPQDVQALLKQGALTVGHAKAALSSSDPSELAKEIVEKGLSVRQAEKAAKAQPKRLSKKSVARTSKSPADIDPDVAALEAQLSETLGLDVMIDVRGTSGRISISYTDLDQLDRVIELLQG